MTNPQKEDAFDFEAAVAQARRDYPAETKNVTFIDRSSPEGMKLLVEWWMGCSTLFKWGRDLFMFQTEEGSHCDVDEDTNRRALIFDSARDKASFPGAASPAAILDFVFNHELGHFVASNGLGPEYLTDKMKSPTAKDPFNRAEIAADCFGVLRSLSRGTLTAEEAVGLSFQRGVTAGTSHATAQAIDAMMKEAEDKKTDFTKLTLDEIKDMASDYAEKYSACQGESGSLKEKVSNRMLFPNEKPASHEAQALKRQEWLENLSDVCEKSPDKSYSFHVTAKTLSVILATGKDPFTKKDFDVTDKKWDEVREKLKQRAHKTGARHLIFKQA